MVMNSELTRFLAAKSPIRLVDHVVDRVEAADLHLFSSLFFLEKPFSPFQRSFRFLEQLLAEVLFAQADDHFHQARAFRPRFRAKDDLNFGAWMLPAVLQSERVRGFPQDTR